MTTLAQPTIGFATECDILAVEAIPLADRSLPPTSYDAIAAVAAAQPAHPALHFFFAAAAYDRPVSYSYGELIAEIRRTANMLRALGVGLGDVVPIILPNLPQMHLGFLGGQLAGVANPLNPLLEPASLAEIMCAARTKALIALKPFPGTDLWERIAPVLDQVPTLELVLQVDLGQYLSAVTPQAPRLPEMREPRIPIRAQVLDFDRTMRQYPGDGLTHDRTIAPDAVAALFCAGGTTGTPKLAQHTHGNEVYDAWAARLAVGMASRSVLFCGLPLCHVNGLTVTGLAPWFAGATVVLGTPQGYRGPGVLPNFWKIVEHYCITSFSGVPTIYSSLPDVPIGDSDIRSLAFALCGAAPIPTEVFKNFEQRTGVAILAGYGLTEAVCVSTVNPAEGERRVGSVGLRLPYQELRTAVVEGDRVVRFCDPEEVGVVLVRGPNVFPGYQVAEQNRGVFIDSDDGGGPWLGNGDMGRIDRDGYLWLTGRKKELIIRGGHNIDPRQIEEALHRHPAVALAAAVGRPDPRLGEVPVVYVQLVPGASATGEELLSFARAQIGERAAVPKAILILDQIPLTAGTVRDRAASGLGYWRRPERRRSGSSPPVQLCRCIGVRRRPTGGLS
jgi:fatty-acyl-CoA synthase